MNLRLLLAQAGTKAQLARSTGVNQAYLTQLDRNDPNSEGRQYEMGDDLARRLEAGTGKPLGWMDEDHSPAIEVNTGAHDVPPPRRVKVISWLHAGRLDEAMLDDCTDDSTVIYADASIGPRAFALRVRGDSMVDPSGGKSYPDGCLIVIDPDRPEQPNDRVVVRLATAEEAVFKQLARVDGRFWLKPLNPRYPIDPMPADATIIGVVVLTVIPE